MAASFVLQPASIAVGATSTSMYAVGFGTAWTTGTTFSVTAGGTGASVLSSVVNAATQTAVVTFAAGSAVGPLTVGNSADSAHATLNVVARRTARRYWFNGLS